MAGEASHVFTELAVTVTSQASESALRFGYLLLSQKGKTLGLGHFPLMADQDDPHQF